MNFFLSLQTIRILTVYITCFCLLYVKTNVCIKILLGFDNSPSLDSYQISNLVTAVIS